MKEIEKETFEKAEIKIVKFDNEDVITASNTGNDDIWTPEYPI